MLIRSGKITMPKNAQSIHIEQVAAAWLARKDGENWDSDDQAQLTAWLEESLAHRIAYIRLDAAWQQARRLKELVAARSASSGTQR